LAHIRAALRRVPVTPGSQEETLYLDGVEINLGLRLVKARGREFHLTPKEFDLLRYLISTPNVAIPHAKLLQAVWGPDYGDQVEYLRVFVNQLRKKIEPDPAHPRYLLTEPWVGYRLVIDGKR
jgi:two-component system KDP operon response regulator KdpE